MIQIAFVDELSMLHHTIESIGSEMQNILKDISQINEIGAKIQNQVKTNEEVDYIAEVENMRGIAKAYILSNEDIHLKCFEMLIDRFEWMKNLKSQNDFPKSQKNQNAFKNNLNWHNDFIECITANKELLFKNPQIVSKELVDKIINLTDSMDIDADKKHNFIKNIWLPILKFMNKCGIVSDDTVKTCELKCDFKQITNWLSKINNSKNDTKNLSQSRNLQ